MLLSVQNTAFNSCSSNYLGGSLYVDDVQTQEEGKLRTPQLLMGNVQFTGSNSYLGGAMYFDDGNDDQNIYLTASGLTFKDNTADYAASIRYIGTSNSVY